MVRARMQQVRMDGVWENGWGIFKEFKAALRDTIIQKEKRNLKATDERKVLDF